jgi:hypothetical protein
MTIRVRFIVDKTTGEVTLFEVDQEQTGARPEHDGAHEVAAAEIGRVLLRNVQVSERRPAPLPPAAPRVQVSERRPAPLPPAVPRREAAPEQPVAPRPLVTRE